MLISYTRFPYIFWSFTKPFETKIDLKNGVLSVEKQENETTVQNIFKFQRMNFLFFLALKYSVIVIFILISFTKYDFSFERSKLISYCFAFALLIPLCLQNLSRKILFTALFVAMIAAGFKMGDFSLVAFSLKYFITLFLFFTFAVDFQYIPFEVKKEDQVVSHFLIKKDELNSLQKDLA